MPIPRNWSEELVSEWLSLRGYLVEVGVPVGTGGRGGRNEADVVGDQIRDTAEGKRLLEICHVEVGSLSQGHEKDIKTLTNKFSKSRRGSIENRLKERLGATGEIKYEKVYVETSINKHRAERLTSDEDIKQQGIQIWTMKDLYHIIFEGIKEYRNRPSYTAKSGSVMLPESHWMLKLLENLWRDKLGKQ